MPSLSADPGATGAQRPGLFVAREAVLGTLPDTPPEIRVFFEDTWRDVPRKPACCMGGIQRGTAVYALAGWVICYGLSGRRIKWISQLRPEMFADVLKRRKRAWNSFSSTLKKSPALHIVFASDACDAPARARAAQDAPRPAEAAQKPDNRQVRLGNLRGGGKTLPASRFSLAQPCAARQIDSPAGRAAASDMVKRRCRVRLTALPAEMPVAPSKQS